MKPRRSGAGSVHPSALIRAENGADTLRFVVCGGIADGKSALIGALGQPLEMPAAGPGEPPAIAFAHRHVSGESRHLVAIEVRGDEQYTRDIVSAAATAGAAVILIDATKGILAQTKRAGHLIGLLRIHTVVVAVNKMDLVDYSEARFREIESEVLEFARKVGLERVPCIPLSARRGDNVLETSDRMPWHPGPTLAQCLGGVEVDRELRARPFRMPVDRVTDPDIDFRGYAGTILSGSIRLGEEVVIAPSGRRTRIESIVTPEGELERAAAGRAVTLTLSDEINVESGDVIANASEPPGVADQFEATIVWMDEKPMLRGRSYLMRIGGKSVTATIAPLKHKLRVESSEHIAATKLERNEIGVCAIECSQPIAFDPYQENRETGGFILIDRITNKMVGAGLISFALRRSANVRWQALNIDKRERAMSLQQLPTVLWLTGLSGAGKSTIANLVESELHRRRHHTYMLDGDNVRHGLNADLGFTEADRVENIRRVSEVAKLMVDAGLIVLVSFISPFRAERRMARSLFEPEEFIEVYVDTPLAVAEERDTKGLYKKARRGDLVNFTGIDSPYEPPDNPEICVNTIERSAREAAQQVLQLLEDKGRLGPPEG